MTSLLCLLRYTQHLPSLDTPFTRFARVILSDPAPFAEGAGLYRRTKRANGTRDDTGKMLITQNDTRGWLYRRIEIFHQPPQDALGARPGRNAGVARCPGREAGELHLEQRLLPRRLSGLDVRLAHFFDGCRLRSCDRLNVTSDPRTVPTLFQSRIEDMHICRRFPMSAKSP